MERNYTSWFNLQNSQGANFQAIDQNSKPQKWKNQDSLSLFQKFPIRDQQSRSIYQNLFNNDNTISFHNYPKHFNQQPIYQNPIASIHPQQTQNISDLDDSQSQCKLELKKGLKSLAKVLLKTLKKKKFTSSKDVAQNIQKLLLTNMQNRHEFQKQSKNIRRRIYDALNVMMSAGLLERDFSLVRLINFDCEIQKSKLRISRKLQIENKLIELKDKIQKKRSVQQRLRKKSEAIQFWMSKRQQNNHEKCEQDGLCPCNKREHLHFPIIFFKYNNLKASFKLARNKQSFLISQYEQNLCAFGEIDMFQKMKDIEDQRNSHSEYHESQSRSTKNQHMSKQRESQRSLTKQHSIYQLQEQSSYGVQIIGQQIQTLE